MQFYKITKLDYWPTIGLLADYWTIGRLLDYGPTIGLLADYWTIGRLLDYWPTIELLADYWTIGRLLQTLNDCKFDSASAYFYYIVITGSSDVKF